MEGIVAIMDQVMGEARGVVAVGVGSGSAPLGGFSEHWAVLSVLAYRTITT